VIVKANEPQGALNMPTERRWLRASEASEYLGIHVKSVYRACKQRLIPFSKAPGIGVRIDKAALDKLLETGELGAKRGRPRKANVES
jgi:excisionase family DNA binding protein